MGNDTSHPNDQYDDPSQFDGIETLGYRILGVQPNSPASRAGLVSFFDFLVGVNGQLMFGCEDPTKVGHEGLPPSVEGGEDDGEFFEDVDFPALLKGSINQEIELLVWNIKSRTQRFINLTPSTSWGGTGLLGVTIRTDDYSTAEDHILRVLSVSPRSPAALAGLTPLTDFLLGTTHDSFRNEDSLAELLEDFEGKPTELYVYNSESDVVRVVTILPTREWGNGADYGLLGAEVGRGYLHRLPKACRETGGVSFERRVRGAILDVAKVEEDGTVEGEGLVKAMVEKMEIKNAAEGNNVSDSSSPEVVVAGGEVVPKSTKEVAVEAPVPASASVPAPVPSPSPSPAPALAPTPTPTPTVDPPAATATEPPTETKTPVPPSPSDTSPLSFQYTLPPMPKLSDESSPNAGSDAISKDYVDVGALGGSKNTMIMDLPPPPPLSSTE